MLLGLTGVEWEGVIAALATGAVTVLTAVGIATRQSARHVKGVRRDLETNHGKRPGEYLEMVADVKVGQDIVSAQLSNLTAHLVAHAELDAKNFKELRELLEVKAPKGETE